MTLRFATIGDGAADISSFDLAVIPHPDPDPFHDRLDAGVAAPGLRVDVVSICEGVEDVA